MRECVRVSEWAKNEESEEEDKRSNAAGEASHHHSRAKGFPLCVQCGVLSQLCRREQRRGDEEVRSRREE